MSRQDHNGLIDTSLRFGGDKDSGSTACMNRIVCVGQNATVNLPSSCAVFEAGVLQKVNLSFSVEDTR